MWIDDAIYLTTGVVLLSLVALVVVLVRNRGTLAPQLVLVDRSYRPGWHLWSDRRDSERQGKRWSSLKSTVVTRQTVFRQIGSLSFIVGNDLFPGEDWNRGPTNACDASGDLGTINLPIRSDPARGCSAIT